ncbi:MAG TPA: pseudouridine synthase [Terrimicrobiaceae bacterium]
MNRFLAAAGFGSRRGCEELIREGKVSLNGHFIRDLATIVRPGDDVRVAGKPPPRQSPLVHILLHKPKGVLCTRSDERARPTVFDFVPPHFGRLFHAGRLDKDSEGLILLTNDGDLSQRLTHPTHEVEKEYDVFLDKPFDSRHTAKLLRGFVIVGGRARAERVEMATPTLLKVVLRQGIKRQIRLMFFHLGYEVERLVRTRIGRVKLGTLQPGHWRLLDHREVALLAGADKTTS